MASAKLAVQRGEVWVVDLDPVIGSEEAKTRPCIVIQRDAANRTGRTTIVVPVTDAHRKIADRIRPLLRAGDGGLSKDSLALCRQVRVIDAARLRARLGILEAASLTAVSRGLVAILDLEGVA
jgi:mRNA interferase MazF